MFGFSNNDVADGNFTTVVGSPTEYVLKPQGDDKFVLVFSLRVRVHDLTTITLAMISIELASPPEGASDLAYYLGVDGDDKVGPEVHISRFLLMIAHSAYDQDWQHHHALASSGGRH